METEQVKVEPEKIVWKNHLTGEEYDNSLDISYYQNSLKDEKYQNLLLGNFNKEGNYTIEVELLKELVNVNKYITDVVDGTYCLTAETASGSEFKTNFLLKIKKQEDGRKVASLILLEEYSSSDNTVLTTFNTVIARYRDEDDLYFLSKVAKVFHIFDRRNEDGKQKQNENEEILLHVLLLKRSMMLLRKKLAESNEYLSQYYIDSVLALLKANPGKFSEYVLKKYAELLENNKGNFGKPNYYKLLRLELDKIINGARKACDNPELLKAIDSQKKAFIESYNKFEDNIKNPPIAAPQTKKAAAKAKAAGSASKSGSKGGKGGKASKKPAAKKGAAAKKATPQYPKPKAENNDKYITITLKSNSKTETKQPDFQDLIDNALNALDKDLAEFNVKTEALDDLNKEINAFNFKTEALDDLNKDTSVFNAKNEALDDLNKDTSVFNAKNEALNGLNKGPKVQSDSFELS